MALHPSHEMKRLDALKKLSLLDTPVSESFDRVTRMAAQIFNLPVAAVSLTDVDRQWFKSRVGIDHVTIPRDGAPCAQVAETTDALVIPDFAASPEYCDSPLGMSGIRFYAGAPLVTREGYGLGALCVLGTEPRQVTDAEMAALKDLASIVMSQIEMRHAFGRVEPVSGLPNRLQFLDDLADLALDAGGTERLVAVLDLGQPHHLERLATVMGPTAFDTAIAEAGRVLREFLEPQTTAYHVAPAQLAFIAPEGVDEDAYQAKLRDLLTGQALSPEIRYVATPVCGLTRFNPKTTQPEDCLRALFSAAQDVRAGHGLVGVYSASRDVCHQRRFRLLNDFSAALADPAQLRIVFQPRIDLATGRMRSAETLLRWTHPELGDISPAEFIPVIESSPLVEPLTAWVLDASLRQIASWQRRGLDIGLSVNISASNLNDVAFADHILAALTRHGVDPGMLELELTESSIMQDANQAMLKLDRLIATGITLAIDDFGTGYSSLSYLQKLPASVVKIDRSFIKGLEATEREQTLVHSMIKLSHDLGYRVVAEGIETMVVADMLREMGCDEGQGYLFCRPLGVKDFECWARANDGSHGRETSEAA
jgi:EAL domain-containing protein (putative c-di-GMP-specific phosphodiesterase class I)/GGDEF domain-containing protein